MTTENTTDAQEPQEAAETAQDAQEVPQEQETPETPASSTEDPQDTPEEPEEPVDWATLTKTRSEAANLRRRYRETKDERDQAVARIAELEAQVQQFETARQEEDAAALRRRLVEERGLPDSALDLVTGTTEEEIGEQLERITNMLATATPGGPTLRNTVGPPPQEHDWAGVIKNR